MAYAVKHFDTLKKIHRCGKSQRPHLIAECDEEKVYAICECFDNALRGKIPLTTRQKQRLKKHYNTVKNLADPSINWKKKRDYFKTQEGGSLIGTALGFAIPALVSYFASK
jgi:hypothetical protein